MAYQDKDAEYLRKLNNQYVAESQMMTELERYKGLEIYKAERLKAIPNIEARARKVLTERVAELKNAEKFLATERKKAMQRTTESPRLPNALALARVDWEMAERPEDLVTRLEMVKASGDDVVKLAYAKQYKASPRKFTETEQRIIANRVSTLAGEMEYEIENPPTVLDAEMRLQESTAAVIQTRDEVRKVAKEFGLTSLDIWAEDSLNVRSGQVVAVNLNTAEMAR